jgi:CRISPR-associated endonuclease/helicase Cas3
VQFIVVATPVEEIGRDHDFDWAIIEPSSSQSIVQTAGRVNRHRLISVTMPNVALLQFCYKEVKGKVENEKRAFFHPGLEFEYGSTTTHPSHDLKKLFNWSELQQIDARMRFNTNIHNFAKYDDNGIEQQVKEIFPCLLTTNHLWMAKEIYTDSSLRSCQPSVDIYLANEPNASENYKVSCKIYQDNKEELAVMHRLLRRVNNDWLMKHDQELIEDAQKLSIDRKQAMTVSISCHFPTDKKSSVFVWEKICRHRSFGFYIE